MALIDSDNFITHLVWSGLVDKATCGELKEAIELCTVKDIYTKEDLVAMLEEIDLQFDEICFCRKAEWKTVPEIKAEYKAVIQQKINKLRGDKDAKIQCTTS